MSLESEMRSILVADAAVAALVGTRIYPWQREEGSALPAIVYRNPLEEAKQSLRSEVRLSQSMIEYECIASTIAQAKSIAEAVRQALAGTTGTLGSIGQVAIRHTATRTQFYDPTDGGSDGPYGVFVEFTILHRTPALV